MEVDGAGNGDLEEFVLVHGALLLPCPPLLLPFLIVCLISFIVPSHSLLFFTPSPWPVLHKCLFTKVSR